MEAIVAASPQKLHYCGRGEEIVTLANPLSHSNYDHRGSINLRREIGEYHDPLLFNIPAKPGSFPSIHLPSVTSLRDLPMDPLVISPSSRVERSPVKGGERTKKTLPKLVNIMTNAEEDFNGFESESSPESDGGASQKFETPPNLVPRRRSHRKSLESPEEDLSHDYRRFSSRSKKKTSFYGVLNKTQAKSKRRGRGEEHHFKSMRGVKRVLDFGDVISDQGKKSNVVVTKEAATAGKERSEQPLDKEKSVEKVVKVAEGVLHCVPPVGHMMWGKLPGYDWWPGCIISHNEVKEEKKMESRDAEKENKVWIKWYGETQLSQILVEKLAPFESFKENYNPLRMKGLYKRAVMASIKEAARRCKMEFMSDPNDKKPRWVVSESSSSPTLIATGQDDMPKSPQDKNKDGVNAEEVEDGKKEVQVWNGLKAPPAAAAAAAAARGRKGRGRGDIVLTALEQEMVDWALNGFLPMGPKALMPTAADQMEVEVIPIDQSPGGGAEGEEPQRKKSKVMLLQIRKQVRFDEVLEGRLQISELCLGCGDLNVVTSHPLFEGGFCKDCKDSFMECAYMFDDDGTQMYCSICSGGEEVFMCDADNCAKVYCEPCILKLCGHAEVEKVRGAERWLCYMCCPENSQVGLLSKREDWDVYLRELFMNDHEMEYEAPPIYRPIPPDERRPIRVLGLFDGIGTGFLVLKELGFEIQRYIASEIDIDAVNVSRVHHVDIVHVGDIQKITEKEVRAWGPFDLVFGGSPCNDLSIVNPARKGIYEGTGRLFFDFFRILSIAKPSPEEDRPFFWLYENVVSMRPQDKCVISRFLQCNPVVVDAKDISSAHRARYFWGNLPGMNRTAIPLPGDRLTLQECLEPNCFRSAQFTKLRTITTKMNSIKQTKKAIFPVMVKVGGHQEEEDVLWCTEMERLFGFPEHYTDVCNLGRSGRQRLLGKAWSVPVIRHLLSPLKDYFKSSTTKETSNESKGGTKDQKQLPPETPPKESVGQEDS